MIIEALSRTVTNIVLMLKCKQYALVVIKILYTSGDHVHTTLENQQCF